jgi:glycosyltransferase involved in cell wall biosynthesis
MISIIVPAHNEESVVASGLTALTEEANQGELEVIVVCNGCTDRTAQIARAFGPPVTVIETDVASKPHALNLGDRAASGFPRFYVDADVALPLAAVRQIAQVLERGPAIAAAPAVENVFLDGADPRVRTYYEVWMALPYVQEGMMAAGAYALSEQGRARFGDFPDVIADDGYVRLLFGPGERIEVAGAVCRVLAPMTLADLIKIKTRSRLGVIELAQRFPELYRPDAGRKAYGKAFLTLLSQPRLYGGIVLYAWVTALARARALRQARNFQGYAWERDNSSRAHAVKAKV